MFILTAIDFFVLLLLPPPSLLEEEATHSFLLPALILKKGALGAAGSGRTH